MTELKNSTESCNSRLGQAEERISELKVRSILIIQSEEQKEKERKEYDKGLIVKIYNGLTPLNCKHKNKKQHHHHDTQTIRLKNEQRP